tara:strand:+ start:3752 stop:3991 length:240 start_codon:yes stop_codon:yes gene_type:complete
MSNFKIAIVVDMWLSVFDVPSLDSIYIDKPVKRHNLIQTISCVNRSLLYMCRGLAPERVCDFTRGFAVTVHQNQSFRWS